MKNDLGLEYVFYYVFCSVSALRFSISTSSGGDVSAVIGFGELSFGLLESGVFVWGISVFGVSIVCLSLQLFLTFHCSAPSLDYVFGLRCRIRILWGGVCVALPLTSISKYDLSERLEKFFVNSQKNFFYIYRIRILYIYRIRI